MSRARSTLATVSLILSLALAPASALAQPAPGPDPGQSAAPPDATAEPPADPSATPPPAAPPPAPPLPPPPGEPPVLMAPMPALFRVSGYNSLNLGFPMGSIQSNVPLSNAASRVFQLEGGPDLVIANRVIVGFNASVGLVGLGDNLDSGCHANNASCWGINFDFGAHLEVLLLPAGSSAVPWIGVEGGYELLAFGISDGANSGSLSYLGNQFELRAGIDFHFRERGGWGPFIGYQFGKYTSEDISDSSNTSGGTMDVANQASHGWLVFGLRGRL